MQTGRHRAGAQHDRPLHIGYDLEHRAALHVEDARRFAHRFLHQLVQIRALQRTPAEEGDRGLLRSTALQLGLGELALGDVRENPVPAQPPQLVGEERRVIAHPDRPAVAMQHPILLRRPRFLKLELPCEDALTVLGMNTPGPQTRVGQPLLRRVPQDRLDLGAHVVPGRIDAGLRDIDDRGQALDERARLQLGERSTRRRGP